MTCIALGQLVPDVRVGEWSMPWNARDGVGRLGPGVTEAEFTAFVKSTYRVLLTRGLRGCYVYFMDAPTRDFLFSRTERASRFPIAAAADTMAEYGTAVDTDV